jgi:hypothetical protein
MAQTQVVISTSGQTFQLPGTHWTPAQVASTFSESVSGIGSMAFEVTTSGEDQVITFRPRTGSKGAFRLLKALLARAYHLK